jgi:hypothetical protein
MAPFLNSMTSAYDIEFRCPTLSAFRFRPCFIIPETGQVDVNWSISPQPLLPTLKFASGREVNTCVISHVLKELNNHQLCKPHVRPAWRKLIVMGCCPTSRSTKCVPMSSCGKRSTTCCLPRSTEYTLKRQTKNCQLAKVPREQNKLPIT